MKTEAAAEPPAAEVKAAVAPRGTSRKKLFVLVGAVIGVFVLAGAAFLFFGAEEPPPPPIVRRAAPKAAPPTPAEQPAATPGPASALADTLAKADARTAATNEPTATAEKIVSAPAPSATPSVAPPAAEKPPAAPPPSDAFRTWVQNLRISGVAAGANPRVLIGNTAYEPGDLVNPQLGISFATYNAETRMLVFKDKTGAVVERRH